MYFISPGVSALIFCYLARLILRAQQVQVGILIDVLNGLFGLTSVVDGYLL